MYEVMSVWNQHDAKNSDSAESFNDWMRASEQNKWIGQVEIFWENSAHSLFKFCNDIC
jgi:hypothetical protein